MAYSRIPAMSDLKPFVEGLPKTPPVELTRRGFFNNICGNRMFVAVDKMGLGANKWYIDSLNPWQRAWRLICAFLSRKGDTFLGIKTHHNTLSLVVCPELEKVVDLTRADWEKLGRIVSVYERHSEIELVRVDEVVLQEDQQRKLEDRPSSNKVLLQAEAGMQSKSDRLIEEEPGYLPPKKPACARSGQSELLKENGQVVDQDFDLSLPPLYGIPEGNESEDEEDGASDSSFYGSDDDRCLTFYDLDL